MTTLTRSNLPKPPSTKEVAAATVIVAGIFALCMFAILWGCL